MFERWGLPAVLVSHTLLTAASPVINLLAGASRFPLAAFLAYCVAGRLIWTIAFMGLGYAIGPDPQAATGFLTNLAILFLAVLAIAAAGLIASGKAAFQSVPRETSDI
ncbi:hypothetical protein WI90_21010 [Burkholderia ubonensis]|nr:hypothetical protein WI90_21010 [Burkholderia ubonensis]